mmetsp:Transcript_15895/g.23039  ORF Transcript_15895/g.23039 Transcript_15895/m.23039 type:complete len:193 (-) Transcript_15895:24-602(-)
MNGPAATETFYNRIITKTCEKMRIPFSNAAIPEEVLMKIKKLWEENLVKQKEFPHEHYSPEREEVPEPPVYVPEVKPELPPEEPVVSEASSEEEEEEDEYQQMFQQKKAEEKQFKQEEVKIEPPVLKEEPISDDETSLASPRATDHMYCMYNKVDRKSNRWNLQLAFCVLQSENRGDFVFRSASANLNFMKS